MFFFFRVANREIYNLSMVSGPALLKKGEKMDVNTCWAEATKNELKELRMGLKDGLPEDKLQRYMELVNSHKAEKRTNS